MTVAAILLAAGRGERLGAAEGKAFLSLGGRPLLAFAVEAVDGCHAVPAFVVVAPPGREDDAKSVASASRKLHAVMAGGDRRQDSVRRGIDALPEDVDVVVCHDVARPFADAALFDRVIAGLGSADGVVPTVPLADTVKRVDGGEVVETVARDGLVAAQTPQVFRRGSLEEAHAAADRDRITATDDAAFLERAGYRVVTVPGEPGNRKLTVPEDLTWAEAMLGRG